jgi:hypothetical protein
MFTSSKLKQPVEFKTFPMKMSGFLAFIDGTHMGMHMCLETQVSDVEITPVLEATKTPVITSCWHLM